MDEVLNSKVVKEFTKGLLVIIGLFVVLYCGMAALVLLFSDKLGDTCDLKIFAFILILVLVSIPVIVFFGFLRFVKSYCKTVKNQMNVQTKDSTNN